MDDTPIIIKPDPRADPDGRKLRGALEAHLRCEQARSVRRTMMAVTLVPGSFLWATAIWPALGEEARGFGIYGWFACCAAVALAAASEWRWRQASARLTAP